MPKYKTIFMHNIWQVYNLALINPSPYLKRNRLDMKYVNHSDIYLIVIVLL